MKVARRLIRARRGVAALEFALVMPVLLIMLGGVVDFGLVMLARSQLASAVTQGAEYAMATGSSVSPSSIRTMVQSASPLAGVTATVTPSSGAACYCVTGTPLALSSHICTSACPDGSSPGVYLTIKAQYTYQPILPFYSALAATTLSEQAQVRLQ
ncbi:MAG: pilus assembly protein [Rhodospirillales bacterium]|nr:pilus assembly protein [Rhodospirillales bacterium]